MDDDEKMEEGEETEETEMESPDNSGSTSENPTEEETDESM